MLRGLAIAAVAVSVAVSVSASCAARSGTPPAGGLSISSPVFAEGAGIPAKYTCDGADVSPPLAWSGVPEAAKTLALIVDDPDAPDPAAPKVTWIHWVVYNLPAASAGLPEAVAAAALPQGAVLGTNDFKQAAWGGPCPPVGRHRYFFKLYALDSLLPAGGASKAEVEAAMAGHVLATAQLVGTYQKKP